jgi:hypothetical protein
MSKKHLANLLFPFYLLVCGEIIMRVIAAFSLIPDIELLIYARDMTRPSTVAGLRYEHVPNASMELMRRRMTFDGLGNRNSELTNPKAENERRLYFMGTSIMLGWGVGDNETMAADVERRLLERKSPETKLSYRTINAGVAGFNTAKELALLRHQFPRVKPDAVIMQYHLRDSEPEREISDSQFLQYSYLAAYLYQYARGFQAGEATSIKEHYRTLHKDGQAGWEQSKKAVRELQTLSHQEGFQLAVLIIPDLRNPARDGPFQPIYGSIKRFFLELGIAVIDPHEAVENFVGESPQESWVHPSDPHPNANIQRIFGQAVYDFLDRNQGFL